MTGARAFWIWCAVGVWIVPLNSEAVHGGVPGIAWALGFLTTPGVLLCLPVVNLLDAGWQAVSAIAFVNGLFYGLVALAIVRLARRPPEW